MYIILVGSEGIEPPTFRSTTALTPSLFMNIDKFPNPRNNFCSTFDNNCTKTSDLHNPGKLHRHDHIANIYADVQTSAFLCVLLCVLVFRLDILQFFWTLLYGFIVIIRKSRIFVTKSKGKIPPTSFRYRRNCNNYLLSI